MVNFFVKHAQFSCLTNKNSKTVGFIGKVNERKCKPIKLCFSKEDK